MGVASPLPTPKKWIIDLSPFLQPDLKSPSPPFSKGETVFPSLAKRG